jgi:hypothetical protein
VLVEAPPDGGDEGLVGTAEPALASDAEKAISLTPAENRSGARNSGGAR